MSSSYSSFSIFAPGKNGASTPLPSSFVLLSKYHFLPSLPTLSHTRHPTILLQKRAHSTPPLFPLFACGIMYKGPQMATTRKEIQEKGELFSRMFRKCYFTTFLNTLPKLFDDGLYGSSRIRFTFKKDFFLLGAVVYALFDPLFASRRPCRRALSQWAAAILPGPFTRPHLSGGGIGRDLQHRGGGNRRRRGPMKA